MRAHFRLDASGYGGQAISKSFPFRKSRILAFWSGNEKYRKQGILKIPKYGLDLDSIYARLHSMNHCIHRRTEGQKIVSFDPFCVFTVHSCSCERFFVGFLDASERLVKVKSLSFIYGIRKLYRPTTASNVYSLPVSPTFPRC
jgi:hypothetical protein